MVPVIYWFRYLWSEARRDNQNKITSFVIHEANVVDEDQSEPEEVRDGAGRGGGVRPSDLSRPYATGDFEDPRLWRGFKSSEKPKGLKRPHSRRNP